MASFGDQFLDGQVAIVTGAAQGNGFAISKRLAAHGAKVAAIDINAEGMRAAARRLGDRVTPFSADCSRVAEIHRTTGEIVGQFGRVDILVNNAGILRIASFPDIGEADFDATIALNLKGAFFFTQEVQASLGTGARIVNIASVAGVDGRTLSAPYAATKAGLITITKTLARALAGRGITVNAAAPGLIDTPFDHILDQKIGVERQGLKPGEMLAKRAAEIPLGRIGDVRGGGRRGRLPGLAGRRLHHGRDHHRGRWLGHRLMDCENAVALITGAGTGVGLAAARRFAAAGCRVVATVETPDQLPPALQCDPPDTIQGRKDLGRLSAVCPQAMLPEDRESFSFVHEGQPAPVGGAEGGVYHHAAPAMMDPR